MISLKKEFLILIYEKEKLLNSILDYQISNYNNSKSHCVNNSEDLFLDISKKKFDTYILNLNDLDNDLERFLDTLNIKTRTIISLVIMKTILKVLNQMKLNYSY